MAVVIVQTGAKKPGPGKKGVALPPGGVLISVTHLPNPYNKLDAFKREQGIADADWPSRKRDQVKQFLWHRAEPQLRRVLARAEKAIKRGKPVGIVCGFGRDRSPAVALNGARGPRPSAAKTNFFTIVQLVACARPYFF